MEHEGKTAGAGPLSDFIIGQRVMTVEGFPGVVEDIHEGPSDLTTIFVTLDDGQGGGEYAEAELTPLPEQAASSTASTATTLAAMIEAGVTHTAVDDYPELGTILTDRLPPTLQQRIASKDSSATCTGCGESYDPQNPAGDLHDHWTQANRLSDLSSEEWGDDLHTAGTSISGKCETCGKAIKIEKGNVTHADGSNEHAVVSESAPIGMQALYLPPKPSSEQRASTSDITPGQKAGYDDGFSHGKGGVTRQPAQPTDGDYMTGYDLGWAEGVTVAREPANSWEIDDLGADQTAGIPASLPTAFGPTMGSVEGGYLDKQVGEIKEWMDENPGYSYDWCRFRRNSHCHLPSGPDTAATQLAGYPVWVPQDRGVCWMAKWDVQKTCSTSLPGPHAPNGFTDATIPWSKGGQRNGEQGPASDDPTRYGSGVRPTGLMDTTASLSTTAAFEFTATWKDVQAKAKRIRAAGGVRMVAAQDNVVVGHIKGDNGVYETEIVSMPGRRNAASWSCGCKWAGYSWGRSGPWKKFEGRMCSHALALSYEAQSRLMNGKTITLDEKQPAWMDGQSLTHSSSLVVVASPIDDRLRANVASASTLEAAAKAMLALARREEPKVVTDLQTLAGQNHGELVGLDFRFKSGGSLMRKMTAEQAFFRSPGETAMNMSDTLRFTMLFSPEKYTEETKETLEGLRSKGYKTRIKNYWGRGDAYNGVNVALTTPTGHPCELQFHTEASFYTKEKEVHPIYEAWREEKDPNIKAILGARMRDLFDMVPRPNGSLGIEDRKRQPMTPYKDINWFPGKAAALGDAYRYLALHTIDGDPETPDPVYAVLRITDASSEVWEHGQWLDDPEFGRYSFLGDPKAEEISEDEAELLIGQMGMQAVSRRTVAEQTDDEIPAVTIAAHALARGIKYASIREMLLSSGIEAPAKVVEAARKTARYITEQDLIDDKDDWSLVVVDLDGSVRTLDQFVHGHVAAKEYVQVGNEQYAREVVETSGTVTVDGQTYGTLRRDTNRATSKEWVLTGPDGKETEHPSKGGALFYAGKHLSPKTAKNGKDEGVPYSEHGDERLKDAGVSVAKTKDGKYYVHTHRARGESHDSVADIPDSEIKSIEATGSRHPFPREAGQKTASTRLYHIADKVDFRLDPKKAPQRNTTMGGDMKPGIFLCADPETWMNGYGYWRPWLVEFEVPNDVRNTGGGYGNEIYVLAEDYDKIRITRVIAIDAFARERFSDWGWSEDHFGTTYDTEEPLPPKEKGSWSEYGRFPGNHGSTPDARHMPADWQARYKKRITKFRQQRGKGVLASMPTEVDDRCTACSGTGEQRSGHECYICEATGSREAELEGRAAGIDNSNPENGLPVGQDDSKVLGQFWPIPGLMTDSLRPQAAMGDGWLINGKPYTDGVWIEVEHDKWYRGSAQGEIPGACYASLSEGKWEWMARASTFIGAPHENRAGAGPARGSAKTLEQAQAKAQASLKKDHEFFAKYQERMDRILNTTAAADQQVEVSGVALVARDTGRVLFLQRALTDNDDNGGKWEFPGGHHEDGDVTSLHAGIREWEEEVGQKFPEGGEVINTWTSPDGIYRGHVVAIDAEADLELHVDRVVDNPDEDGFEQAAWWAVDDAKKNPALREECKKTPWDLLRISTPKEGSKMDTADEFGSLFDTAASGISSTAAWGDDLPYNWSPGVVFSGPNAPHPGLGHTMDNTFVDNAPVTIDENPEAALPVTYGEDEATVAARQIAAAMQPDPQQQSFSTTATTHMSPNGPMKNIETDEEKGRRLLAYVDASLSGQPVSGPDPFAYLGAGQADNELAGAAQNYLATKGAGIQTQALRTYDPRERQAIIEEGIEVRATNLDRLDISGTHYEALDASRTASVPEDEDLTFLDGDPNGMDL